MNAPVVDAHAHTYSQQFDDDRDATFQRAWDAGLVAVVEVGGDVESSRQALALADGDARIHAVAGIHPHEARHLDAQRDELRALIESGRFVGVGEIGFDFHYNHSAREAQFEAFLWQLDLARDTELPVVVHCREADDDGYAVLSEWARRVGRFLGPDREIGMLHCFAGDAGLASRYVDLGFLISIPGPVTYKNNDRGQEVARSVPLAAMLVETDAPYLSPASHRGSRNEPAYVVETIRMVAQLRGCSAEEVAAATAANAARLFGFSIG
ncbi:MAG: TatD family hydrolase [Dehalococcoidia bacterium]